MAISLMRIRLEHFAKIKSGMGQDVLDIDFTKLPYFITLLLGANGTGKTSFLRCLHPFAYNGATGDEGKENLSLILPNQDGKKEVWLGCDDTTWYHITHLYLRKKDKSLTVKSYIAECSNEYGEEELNESGSVNEFKAIMEDSFGLKESYLNLLSIGNTLDSFVKYTSSERKKYAVSLFNTLDLYPGFYKRATAVVREVKPLLSNVTAKLEQYRNVDLADLDTERKDKKRTVDQLRTKVESLLVKKGGYEKQIEGAGDILQTCKEAEDRIRELSEQIEETRRKASGRKLEDTQKELETKKIELESLTKSYDQTAQRMESELRSKDQNDQTLTALKTTLARMEKNLDKKELEEQIAYLEKKKQEVNLPNDFPRPALSSEELIGRKLLLDQLRGQCYPLLEFDVRYPGIVLAVWEAIQEDPTKADTLIQKYKKANQDLIVHRAAHPRTLQLSQYLQQIQQVGSCEGSHTEADCEDCPYRAFYVNVLEEIQGKKRELDQNDEEKEEIVDRLKAKAEVAEWICRARLDIQKTEAFATIPEPIFSIDRFIEEYMDCRDICDRELLDYSIDMAERYETIDKLDEEISRVKELLTTIQANRSVYLELKGQEAELEKEANVISLRYEDLSKDFNYQAEKKGKLEEQVAKLSNQLTIDTALSAMRSELALLREGLASLKKEHEKVLKLQDQLTKTNGEISEYQHRILDSESQIRALEHTLLTITNLQEERSTLYTKLQEASAIQEAVSPTTGIPMEFLRDSVGKELIRSVNEILSGVYHDKFRLDERNMIIDENDFIIPYTWDGYSVADISQASDGQQAILTMAITIVLLEMTAPEYQVLLLDEADTTLDIHSRAVALELLENFTRKIRSSQVFNITHNSMFDGYPANILLTSEETISNVNPEAIVRCYQGGNGVTSL